MKKFLLICTLFIASLSVRAQFYNDVFYFKSMAIGRNTFPPSNVWLQLGDSLSKKGLMLPRVIHRDSVSNPVFGILVYDMSNNHVYFRNRTTWIDLGAGGGGAPQTLQEVLSAGSTLSQIDTINLNGFPLYFQGGQIVLKDASLFTIPHRPSDPLVGQSTNGDIYYNTATNKFRCYENTAWVDWRAAGGTIQTEMSVTGDGSSGSKAKLVNDNATPGNNMVYGTNGSGVKGWKADPAVGGGTPGGSNLEYQFNNSSAFGGAVGGKYNPSTRTSSFDSVQTLRQRIADSLVSLQARFRHGAKVGDSLSLYTDSVLLVGTSITFGANATGGNDYATQVANAFGAVLINKGVPGTTINAGANSILNRLSDIYTYRSSLRFLVIELGINDRSGDSTTVATTFQRVLDTVQARGWPTNRVILTSPSFTGAGIAYFNQQLGIYIRNAAAARGYHFADVYSYMASNGGYSNFSAGDSLHPNNAGHINMARAIINTLSNTAGFKTNGFLDVAGHAIVRGRLDVNSNSNNNVNFTSPMRIKNFANGNPTIVIEGNSTGSAPVFTAGIKFVPNSGNAQNDSITQWFGIGAGYRSFYALYYNQNIGMIMNRDRNFFFKADSGNFEASVNFGFLGKSHFTDRMTIGGSANAVINSFMLKLVPASSSTPGQYTELFRFDPYPGQGTDSLKLRVYTGTSYNNRYAFTYKNTDLISFQNTTNTSSVLFNALNVAFATPTTAGASFILPPGVAPTTPSNGMHWATSTALYGHYNGTTQQFAFLSNLSSYAPLASPALTGTPTVPTAAAGTNTTQAASTAFVMNATKPVWDLLRADSVTTTNATPTAIGTYTIADNSVGTVSIEVVGNTAGGAYYAIRKFGYYKSSGTLNVGTVTDDFTPGAFGTLGSATSGVTTASNNLVVQGTGVAATTVEWKVIIRITSKTIFP